MTGYKRYGAIVANNNVTIVAPESLPRPSLDPLAMEPIYEVVNPKLRHALAIP
jgi:hypothetical protein